MRTRAMKGSGDRHVPTERTDCIGREKLAWKLAAEQGVKPIEDIGKLYGDFWPEDESADDFITATKAWDKEGQ